MVNLDELLQNSIDMHLHHGPDALMPRRVDALEAAQQALNAGMKAIVLKAHHYPTMPLAVIVGKLVPGIKVFGSICLDYEIGGLNIHALECSAKLGAKMVWMPTLSSANCRGKVGKFIGKPLEGEGFSILDSRGELVPEIDPILSVVKQYDMILANGHMSPSETFALFEAAHKKGIQKFVVTHPSETEIVEEPLTLEDQRRLANKGAFIEHTVYGLLSTTFRHDPTEMAEAIKSIGPEHCIMSTDLGQAYNPPPAEGMRMFIVMMLQKGITTREIELMTRTNPSSLLDLGST